MPARAAYAAIEAEVLPVEAQATAAAPYSRAAVTPVVIPLSLNDPVGFMPWCLKRSPARPQYSDESWASQIGVLPSKRVTTRETSVVNGNSSWNRQTPLRYAGSE